MSTTSILLESGGVPAPPKYDLFVVHAEADRAWVDGYLRHALGLAPTDLASAISSTLTALPLAQRLLLVVDQFEELFGQVKGASMRAEFIAHLKSLRSDPRFTVILTMRADFYGHLMNSPLWPINNSEIIEVGPLRGESLRQAIRKPAEAVGVYLEEALVERLGRRDKAPPDDWLKPSEPSKTISPSGGT